MGIVKGLNFHAASSIHTEVPTSWKAVGNVTAAQKNFSAPHGVKFSSAPSPLQTSIAQLGSQLHAPTTGIPRTALLTPTVKPNENIHPGLAPEGRSFVLNSYAGLNSDAPAPGVQLISQGNLTSTGMGGGMAGTTLALGAGGAVVGGSNLSKVASIVRAAIVNPIVPPLVKIPLVVGAGVIGAVDLVQRFRSSSAPESSATAHASTTHDAKTSRRDVNPASLLDTTNAGGPEANRLLGRPVGSQGVSVWEHPITHDGAPGVPGREQTSGISPSASDTNGYRPLQIDQELGAHIGGTRPTEEHHHDGGFSATPPKVDHVLWNESSNPGTSSEQRAAHLQEISNRITPLEPDMIDEGAIAYVYPHGDDEIEFTIRGRGITWETLPESMTPQERTDVIEALLMKLKKDGHRTGKIEITWENASAGMDDISTTEKSEFDHIMDAVNNGSDPAAAARGLSPDIPIFESLGYKFDGLDIDEDWSATAIYKRASQKGETIAKTYQTPLFNDEHVSVMNDHFGNEFVFRGDSRSPLADGKKLLKSGFEPLGDHSDPHQHMSGDGGNYISTTRKADRAATFPTMGTGHTWIYVIRNPKDSIDVIENKFWNDDRYKETDDGPIVDHFEHEAEVLVPGKVLGEDIHGVQEVMNGVAVGPYIKNPYYKDR